jgi:hypothetical protein
MMPNCGGDVCDMKASPSRRGCPLADAWRGKSLCRSGHRPRLRRSPHGAACRCGPARIAVSARKPAVDAARSAQSPDNGGLFVVLVAVVLGGAGLDVGGINAVAATGVVLAGEDLRAWVGDDGVGVAGGGDAAASRVGATARVIPAARRRIVLFM